MWAARPFIDVMGKTDPAATSVTQWGVGQLSFLLTLTPLAGRGAVCTVWSSAANRWLAVPNESVAAGPPAAVARWAIAALPNTRTRPRPPAVFRAEERNDSDNRREAKAPRGSKLIRRPPLRPPSYGARVSSPRNLSPLRKNEQENRRPSTLWRRVTSEAGRSPRNARNKHVCL